MAIEMKTSRFCVGMFLAGCLLATAGRAAEPAYSFRDLGTLGGAFSNASGINNAGMVVGTSATVAGYSRATLWNHGVALDLGTLGGLHSVGRAINNSGVVVGASETFPFSADGPMHATRWVGTAASDLGTLGGRGSEALGINDQGVVVGRADASMRNDPLRHAARWAGGTVTDLSPGSAQNSGAHAINNAGTVVGFTYHPISNHIQATRWQGGDTSYLDDSQNSYSDVFAIDANGVAVGRESDPSGVVRTYAVQWSDHGSTHLPDLAGSTTRRISASAINSVGSIVGMTETPFGNRAILWENGEAIDLNTLLPAAAIDAGWTLDAATGINDNGWIVGNASNGRTHETHAFLLSPVPEPETGALMLLGLGFIAWRRARPAGR